MENFDTDIPYGHVRIQCKGCGANYYVGQRDLKNKSAANNGYYPCDKCGSRDTTWEFRKIEKEGVSK